MYIENGLARWIREYARETEKKLYVVVSEALAAYRASKEATK